MIYKITFRDNEVVNVGQIKTIHVEADSLFEAVMKTEKINGESIAIIFNEIVENFEGELNKITEEILKAGEI